MGGGARCSAPQKPPFRDIFDVLVAMVPWILVATVGSGSLLLEALAFPFGERIKLGVNKGPKSWLLFYVRDPKMQSSLPINFVCCRGFYGSLNSCRACHKLRFLFGPMGISYLVRCEKGPSVMAITLSLYGYGPSVYWAYASLYYHHYHVRTVTVTKLVFYSLVASCA